MRITTIINKYCQTGLISSSKRTADLIDRETENIRYLDFSAAFSAVSHAILISYQGNVVKDNLCYSESKTSWKSSRGSYRWFSMIVYIKWSSTGICPVASTIQDFY